MWENGRLIDLGTLGGKESDVGPYELLPTSTGPASSPINEHGQVIGWAQTPDSAVHGFVWSHGHLRDLGTLGGRRSAANAINDRGQIVGSAQAGDSSWHAFLWERGRMRDLGTLGGANSWASAINERGEVVGVSQMKATNDGGDAISHAFLWHEGIMRDLGTLGGPESEAFGLNDRGQVVGAADTRGRYPDGWPITHAFLWERGRMADLGVVPGNDSVAILISPNGRVAGCVIDYGNFDNEQIFSWKAGDVAQVGPRESLCELRLGGQSRNGRLVGSHRWNDLRSRGFVWETGSLTELVDPAHVSLGSEATAINPGGTVIVGWANEKAAYWTLK